MQFLYRFSKVNGLVPFYFDFDKKRAFASTTSVLYSIVFTLVFSSYVTYYIYVVYIGIIDIDDDLLVVLMLSVDMVTTFLKPVLVYILQLIRRHELIKSINLFIKICEFEQEIDQKFFNKKLTNSCKIKCLSVGIQMISLLIAVSMSDYSISVYQTIHSGIVTMYVSTTTIVVTSGFYCSGMLFSARFYQILDEKVKRLSKSIDENHKEDHIRTIDQISFLYEHITVFTSSICQIYAFQIIISLIGMVVWILSSVKNTRICDFVHWLY